ncbi:hypothetical protein TrRE_jg511, partial [Triparma retinervis]
MPRVTTLKLISYGVPTVTFSLLGFYALTNFISGNNETRSLTRLTTRSEREDRIAREQEELRRKSVYPYRFQTSTFRSLYTTLLHQLLQAPSLTAGPSPAPIVCGKVPVKILRMVKDGDVLGSRIWRYVRAIRGSDPGAPALASAKDQRLLEVLLSNHLTGLGGGGGKGDGGAAREAAGRTEGVHGYKIDQGWDGGIRGNKGTEGFLRYAKAINKAHAQPPVINREGRTEEIWGELQGLIEGVSIDVEVKVGKDKVREVCGGLVQGMIALDKQSTFLEPVEKVVPGYRKFIEEPMCYADIKRNVGRGKYDEGEGRDGKLMGGIRRDFDLVYENCRTFNKKGGRVWVEILTAISTRSIPTPTPTLNILSFLYDTRLSSPGKYDMSTSPWMPDVACYIASAVVYCRASSRALKGGDFEGVDVRRLTKPRTEVMGDLKEGGMRG